MSSTLHVQWIVTSLIAPRPWLTCGRCGGIKPFQSSGKARLNANGKRLDAWLIYKCSDCENTWNRPLFERRNVRDIDPLLLEALQANDHRRIEVFAFDIDGLRRSAGRIEEFGEARVAKQVLTGDPASFDGIRIDLRVPLPCCLRLDRLLAAELGVSRTKIHDLHDAGVLKLSPKGERTLRRPVREGMFFELDASSVGEQVLAQAVTGSATG
ncbi:DUF1062 domain-containing protein [Pseudaminobacter soli (ex Li et al. 2025)]|uniref:DUF1062 domain-containing protein n=1 Tax=Pseudaminobacter soli (ex Li et al. 2025) TaxID=1295366 RepID=A0A2P7S6Y7_9HYPH|nr:DUF1062 domain-containing protein [Mesorhizobium soli]PSJ58238.1 hypothetical protein C7I85_20480 [Mesorhizobium soli]